MDTLHARREDGKLIHATRDMDTSFKFFCFGCDEELYAAPGKKNVPHFRHKNSSSGCGNYESYIHNFSKEKFVENYQYSDRFELRRKVNIRCAQSKYDKCVSLIDDVINLKEKYPNVKLEQRDGAFIPDCLLSNDKGEKIYIEIKYTSPISQNKIDSGIPIVEIRVSTEKEILKIINNGFIDSSDKSIKLINFDTIRANAVYDCKGVCPQDRIIEQDKKFEKERIKEREREEEWFNRHKPTIKQKTQAKPLMDSEAISYLLHYKKEVREKRYAQSVAIPAILGNARRDYRRLVSKYEQREILENSLFIFEEDPTFIFVYLKHAYYGMLRYESYWHIFTVDSKKLRFIESRETREEIILVLESVTNIF